ncbi:MAG: InlB B-repeat-containing protein, partial [Clostridia bacterium]|nr:InlB B-repeat-containing protein [Clostridia bacterium]
MIRGGRETPDTTIFQKEVSQKMKRITAWLLAALMLVAVFPMAALADGESGMDPAGTKYTVTFDKNGGNGEMAAVEVDAGAEYTLPACAFDAPEGKAFDKWDKGAVGAKITVTENTTVTAQWKDAPAPEPVKYTVTFDKNGGNGEMAAVEVDAGAEYT